MKKHRCRIVGKESMASSQELADLGGQHRGQHDAASA